MQGLAIDRLKNTMTLNHITSAVGRFVFMVHEQVHSQVHYIYIYTDVFDIDNSTTLCMYIHIIYIHIFTYTECYIYMHIISALSGTVIGHQHEGPVTSEFAER